MINCGQGTRHETEAQGYNYDTSIVMSKDGIEQEPTEAQSSIQPHNQPQIMSISSP